MATTQPQIIVYPDETVKVRFVTRKFLGFFSYSKIIDRTSMGWRLFVQAIEKPKSVHVNGVEYFPTTTK